jgi:hypothetical protein
MKIQMWSLVKPHKEALFVMPDLIRHPVLLDSRWSLSPRIKYGASSVIRGENDENGVLLMNSLVII